MILIILFLKPCVSIDEQNLMLNANFYSEGIHSIRLQL